jgi:deoxyribodipyrimidine photolyase-related protein
MSSLAPKAHGPTLRLILGDQLNPTHSWFDTVRDDVIYVMMELRQETDYVLHHAQKIIAIFAGMRDLARQLRAAGHHLTYLAIDDAAQTAGHGAPTLTSHLDALIAEHHARAFEYQAPDEWRLDAQLAHHCTALKAQGIACRMVSSEHFYTERTEAAVVFKGRKQWLMEHFYRQMRLKHRVLIDTDEQGQSQPAGGQWNFDHDNRKPWPGLPAAPADTRPRHDHSALWATIESAGVRSFGQPQAAHFGWPLNRAEAQAQLSAFIQHVLPHFGDFEDAMSHRSWRLFHSLLSFALNVKMLAPREVVQAAENAWRTGHVPLAAAEGFIRQILGWREHVRGIYWAHMPGYEQHNALNHTKALPDWFWTGQTKMRCMQHAIGGSLEHAYAHHIQRLMVIGNFALLAGLNPHELHQWYLGVYIDAFEWVELPNTVGMSQFADGGLLATKPYVSSAAYIDRMSDYCKGCHYNKKDRLGEQACPFNALYWNFHLRHADKLERNPRIGMVYKQIAKMTPEAIDDIKAQARSIQVRLESL